MKNHLNTSITSEQSKSTNLDALLEVLRHFKPIGKKTIKEMAYRFGMMPENLYVLLKEFGG